MEEIDGCWFHLHVEPDLLGFSPVLNLAALYGVWHDGHPARERDYGPSSPFQIDQLTSVPAHHIPYARLMLEMYSGWLINNCPKDQGGNCFEKHTAEGISCPSASSNRPLASSSPCSSASPQTVIEAQLQDCTTNVFPVVSMTLCKISLSFYCQN